MKRTNENPRVTSTARKISRSWFWRLFWIFFKLNIVLVILGILGLCFLHEYSAMGSDWSWHIPREIQIGSIPGGVNPLLAPLYFLNEIWNGFYVFHPGPDRCANLLIGSDILAPVGAVMLLICGIEALFLLGQIIAGRRRARKLLQPLDRMAEAAKELGRNASRAPQASGTKLHDLEAAIGRISPEHPEEKLHMGDSDLAGLEEAINSLLSRMHESYRQQAQFVSDASHELRTPIAVIQGYAGMLDRWGKTDEKVLEESIAAIKSETAYMSKLVEQLLFLARGETGKNQMEFKPIQLDELIKEVYEDSILIDQGHDWRIDAAPGVSCIGDWNMLKQCARVLVDNALKYTPKGGVIRLRAYENPQGEACFEVQDSGIGISAEDMQHVFDRFFRSDPARKREGGGAGLGLSIARWIVERHGGHIELLSRPEIGTRMVVHLPWTKRGGETPGSAQTRSRD